MTQLALFPVVVKSIRPAPKPTAHLRWIAQGRDGMAYAMKRMADHHDLPATEWICHHIAQATQLATPGFVQLQVGDELAFGSRWEGDLVDASQLNNFDLINLFHSAQRTSAILGLDAFLCNPDRHLENFLYRRMPDGGLLALAFDYSMAWRMVCRPCGLSVLPTRPDGKESATTWARNESRRNGSFDIGAALETVDAANDISASNFSTIVASIPSPWLESSARDTMVQWWAGPARTERARLAKQWILR